MKKQNSKPVIIDDKDSFADEKRQQMLGGDDHDNWQVD